MQADRPPEPASASSRPRARSLRSAALKLLLCYWVAVSFGAPVAAQTTLGGDYGPSYTDPGSMTGQSSSQSNSSGAPTPYGNGGDGSQTGSSRGNTSLGTSVTQQSPSQQPTSLDGSYGGRGQGLGQGQGQGQGLGDGSDSRGGGYYMPPRPRALPGQFERFVAKSLGRPLPRFGAALMTDGERGFAPAQTAAVPPDYVLNPGDELMVGVTGAVEASDLRLPVDSDGRIFIPKVGAVNVAGVRYGDLQGLLTHRLGQQYRNFKLSVAISHLHGIRIYVTGYAVSPGAYTLSSLSTLVNAVMAAGGPSSGGSFRSIQLRRGGQTVADLDLYDLLLKGDKSHDIALENEDVLFVAPVGREVAINGSVNAEAIYEAKPGETLGDMLTYAGGVNSIGESSRVLVNHISNLDKEGWAQLDMAQAQTAQVEAGDIIRVLSSVDMPRPIERQAILATISGEVAHPGHYYLKPGATLGDLLAQAGSLTSGAYVFGTQLNRASVIVDEKASFDDALDRLQISIASQPLTTDDGSSDSAAAEAARLEAAKTVIAELKTHEPDGRVVLSLAPDAVALPESLTLENDDRIYIPPTPKTVEVFGAVYQPGAFVFHDGSTIRDYLRLAGGPEKVADRTDLYIVRANGSVVSMNQTHWSHDLGSVKALPGDVVFVPVNSRRNVFWDRLKNISSVIYQLGLGAAAVKVLLQ